MKFDSKYLESIGMITKNGLINTENLPTSVDSPPSCSLDRLEEILGEEFLKQAEAKLSEFDPLTYLRLTGYGFHKHSSGFLVYENPDMKQNK